MIQTIETGLTNDPDPALVTWSEAFREAPLRPVLREALSKLGEAVESSRNVIDKIGHTASAGEAKLAS